MFCIKSDVITLGSIEMYSLVTVWTSMDDGPYWVILLKYGTHDMRHTGFRRLTVVNGTPGFWGVTTIEMRITDDKIHVVFLIAGQSNNMNLTCIYVLSNILCS